MSNVYFRAAEIALRKPQSWTTAVLAADPAEYDTAIFDDLFENPRFINYAPDGDEHRVIALCMAGSMREAGDL